jgi:DNA replication and repair protein RecF
MDRELFQLKPLYYVELAKYKKVLRNRNSLLKEEYFDEELLSVYDHYLAEYGAKIMKERAEFVRKIDEMGRAVEHKLTGGKEELAICYESSVETEETTENQRKRIEETLFESREKDMARRSTTFGPHRDDLKITANDVDLRNFGSRGQQRTAALALKLAELRLIKEETGEDAILLLDDVLSELDEERQNYLIHSFAGNQLFITAAEVSDRMKEALPKGKVFEVRGGSVVEM